MKKANVFTSAEYILNKVGTISAMKLQKLLYYCQAWSLVWDEEPLFDSEIQAWKNGPVIRDLYGIHRGMFKIEPKYFEKHCKGQLSEDQKETIDGVIESYNKFTSLDLSQITHMEDPWKNARKGFRNGSNCEEIISHESMSEFYINKAMLDG